MIPQTTVSLLGTTCPRPTGHRYVLADGSQGHLEPDGTLCLCLCDHGFHVDIPLWAPTSVLPYLVAALGLLPPAWHLHGFCGHRHVHFNDDQRQLLLHPQHLAHPTGWQCGISSPSTRRKGWVLGLFAEVPLSLPDLQE